MSEKSSTYNLETIQKALKMPFDIKGRKDQSFNKIDSIFDNSNNSLTWVRGTLPGVETLLNNLKSTFIICDSSISITKEMLEERCWIITENPQIAFMRLTKAIYGKQYASTVGIHPSAIISDNAVIGKNVSIGPFAIVDECTIGDNTTIEAFCKIHGNVFIGKNVLVSEHCNLGGQGFGHIMNEEGFPENMLHTGKVIIEDHVEIFPYTNIDKATLSATIIGRYSMIDHYCHIGHNSVIGEATVITAQTVLCGGTRIGDRCWVGVGSLIKDKSTIGDNVTIGMGSVVTKNIPSNETWTGSPAKRLDEFKLQQAIIKSLVNNQ